MISDFTMSRSALLCCFLLCVMSPAARSQAEPPSIGSVPDLRAAIERAGPAFYRLQTQRRETRYGVDIAEPTITSFSGMLFDERGFILTVGHAIKGASLISAETHQGEISLCAPIGYDPASGVGVVQLSP